MRALGFVPLLSDAVQAPTIVTFRMPAAAQFSFARFYSIGLAQSLSAFS